MARMSVRVRTLDNFIYGRGDFNSVREGSGRRPYPFMGLAPNSLKLLLSFEL